MADKKQVMSWLEGLTFDDWQMYHSDSEVQEIAKVTFELLKDQEAVEPCQHYAVWLCGNCGQEIVGWDDDIDGKEEIIIEVPDDFGKTLKPEKINSEIKGKLVRCKDCKHRPKEPNLETYEDGFDIEFPEDSKCPCQCSSDRYYSWYPEDNWFCAEGERRDG